MTFLASRCPHIKTYPASRCPPHQVVLSDKSVMSTWSRQDVLLRQITDIKDSQLVTLLKYQGINVM